MPKPGVLQRGAPSLALVIDSWSKDWEYVEMTIGKLISREPLLCVAATSSVVSGGRVTLDVSASNVTNLFGAHVVITFYSTIVHADTVEREAVFQGNGESAFFSHDFATASARGSISVDQVSFSPEGVSGSGVLFSITFLGKCRRTSSIGQRFRQEW